MSRAVLASLLLVAAALAGCIAAPGAEVQVSDAPADVVADAASLWPDRQNEPHPAFGWPTLTHPATGAVPAFWEPIAHATLPETVAGLEHVASAGEDVGVGAGIALFGSLAYVPGYGEASYVLGISDPAAPKTLATLETPRSQRGASMIAYPDGRLVAVVSTSAGFDVVDLTDPTKPEIVAEVEPTMGGHKVGVVPGTPIVYNANSGGGGLLPTSNLGMGEGVTEIYDLTDPRAPVHVQDFANGYGCHHVYFWNDASQDKARAICAGIEMTQIWDVADPRDPKVLVNIPVHHGNPSLPSMAASIAAFSHFSILNTDGTILVVGDEFMGGGAAQCDGFAGPGKHVSGPLGNLWFYDVSVETEPKLLGWFSPPPHTQSPNLDTGGSPIGLLFNAAPGCTAHHGRIVPDPAGERELIVMAWYGAGVVLVDFTDPADPWMVDQFADGTDTWEAWYYNGYVFTGDLRRGLDVLTFA